MYISGIDKGRFIAVVPAHVCQNLSELQQFTILEDDNPVIITFEIEDER
jgi:hypothetical protein